MIKILGILFITLIISTGFAYEEPDVNLNHNKNDIGKKVIPLEPLPKVWDSKLDPIMEQDEDVLLDNNAQEN